MIKGAFIFACGMAVGTAYGFSMGLRVSKSIATIAEAATKEPQHKADSQTVQGTVVEAAEPEAATA